jgi:hypothetical protein
VRYSQVKAKIGIFDCRQNPNVPFFDLTPFEKADNYVESNKSKKRGTVNQHFLDVAYVKFIGKTLKICFDCILTPYIIYMSIINPKFK